MNVRLNGIVALGSLILALVALEASPKVSHEPLEVVGEAEIKNKNVAGARNEALQSAMEMAVLEVSREVLPKEVFAKKNQLNSSIDLSFLSTGLYVYRITSQGTVLTEKFLVE